MIWIIVLVSLTLTALVYGVFIEPKWLIISRYNVKVDKPLPKPLKILHLSDTHFHPRNTYINKMFDRLEKLDEEIDVILLTGDIVDNDNGIHLAGEQLGRLKSECGIYAVFGNHDHFWHGKRELLGILLRHIKPKFKNNLSLLQTNLELIGCHVLRNEVRTVAFHGVNILIAGLDDPVTGQDRVEELPKSEDPNQLKILIVHLLDALAKVKGHGFDLAFSGHTHGGQIRIPFLGPIVTQSKLKRKFSSGMNFLHETQVFTSRGIGTSPQVPSRFFCHPEAAIFTVTGS